MPICPACQVKRNVWLDSKPSQVFPTQLSVGVQAHAAYDLTARGMAERATSRHEKWRALVREQAAGIAEHCRATHLETS